MNQRILWLVEILKALASSGYYGKLTVSFEKGIITYVKKEETLKPPPVEY